MFLAARRWPTGNLWRNPDFLKLWAGETVSLFGARFTTLALPLVAAVTLEATPGQMGILGALQFVPFLLVTLFAGVWIDRQRRRPVLILSNLIRALLLLIIPLAAVTGVLSMKYLYVVAFLLGVCQVFFDVSYQAYLPSLVERGELIEGNSKLQMSATAAEIAGPGLAGPLVDLVSAPVTIGVNVITYLVSVFSLAWIRKPEPRPTGSGRVALWREIGDGFRVVFGNRYLRACAAEAACFNLWYFVLYAVFVLYVTRELGISATLLGVIISTSAVGAFAGSVTAGPLAERIGFGRAILASMCIGCLAFVLVPLAAGESILPRLLLVGAFLIGGYGIAISNVHVVSLRQAATPDRLLGRMNASYRFFVYGAMPIGSLIGGGLGELIGLRGTLMVGAGGMALSWLWILFSSVPGLQRLADAAAQPPAAAEAAPGAPIAGE